METKEEMWRHIINCPHEFMVMKMGMEIWNLETFDEYYEKYLEVTSGEK